MRPSRGKAPLRVTAGWLDETLTASECEATGWTALLSDETLTASAHNKVSTE